MSCSLSSSDAWKIFVKAECPAWVLTHTELVRSVAVALANRMASNGYAVNVPLVEVGAILHDVGRAQTQGPTHAHLGARWLRSEAISPEIIAIVECHTGAGLTKDDAASLGLPVGDYTPQTVEAKLVAHADNLCSGPHRVSMDFLEKKYAAQGLQAAFQRIVSLHNEIAAWVGVDPTSVS